MRIWKGLILVLLLACSCRQEEEYVADIPSQEYPEGATVEVSFSLRGEELATKTLGEGGTLNNLYLAVFGKNGYLKEYVQAVPVGPEDFTYQTEKIDASGNVVKDEDGNPILIDHTVNSYTFTARLSLAESKRIIHLIGNGPSTLSFGWDTEVMANLCCNPGEMGYWQILELENGIRAKRHEGANYIDKNGQAVTKGDYIDNDGNKVTTKDGYVPDTSTQDAFKGPDGDGLALIRNWAKIELHAEEDSNFTPVSFAVVSVPEYGTYAPYFSKAGKGTFLKDYQDYSFFQLEEEGYWGNLPANARFSSEIPAFTPVKKADGSMGAVYLYERPAPSANLKPSFVIVYGHFNDPEKDDGNDDSGNYYYRVDLMETMPVYAEDKVTIIDWKSSYYPIYRNFKYTIDIKRILARGQSTPEKAVTSAGSADVSADITTSSLQEISDGIGRLHLSWMSYTHISEKKDEDIDNLFVFFSKNGDAAPNDIKVELLPAEDGGEDIIDRDGLKLGDVQDYEGSEGWRPILFTIKAYEGRVARTQVIRVSGRHDTGRLYRDVYITVQPIQSMKVECSAPIIARVKNTQQIIKFMIPDGLVSSMFPLEFTLEAEDMTLTPDQDVPDNNLPVVSGKSISDNPKYEGKQAFQFRRTLSWEEYRSLPQTRDANSKVWRTASCYFRTNRNVSATTVWVSNKYFDKGHVTFVHYDMKRFNNLTFNEAIPYDEGEPMSISFVLEQDEGRTYPEDYPTIVIRAIGLRRDMVLSPDILPGDDDTYLYKPSVADPDVTLHFYTSAEGGNISIDLSAEEYDDGHLEPCHFSHVGFVDVFPLVSGNNKYSNVVRGCLNVLGNKTVIFAYRDDPLKPNTPVTVTTKLGGTTNPGVVNYSNKTPSWPWTPTGGVRTNADPLYHEIEFQTPNYTSYADVYVTLSSPGYVTEKIIAGKWSSDVDPQNCMNIMTSSKYSLGKVIPQGSTSGVISGFWNESFKCSISIPDVTVSGNVWSLPAGHSCELTLDHSAYIRSGSTTSPLFIVRLGFSSEKGVDYVPDSFSPSVGEVEPYLGDKNQYIWRIPGYLNSATLTMLAPSDHDIKITSLIVGDARDIVFYKNGQKE
jgi:hypothetical protein